MKHFTKKPCHIWFRPSLVLSMILLITLSSCGSSSDRSNNSANKGKSLKFETLMQDNHSNHDDETAKSIRSEEELQALFAKINTTRMPGLDVPQVDFTNEELFFYTMGNQSTGGYNINASKVTLLEDKVEVTLKTSAPAADDYAITVVTSPFVLIKYKRTDLPVSFKREAKN